MGEVNINMNRAKLTVGVLFLACSLAMPNMAFCAEENTRTTPLKSFFTRFVKKKNKEVKKTDDTFTIPLSGHIVFSIDDCVKLGLKNSPEIRKLEAKKRAEKDSVGMAKSNYFPRITAGGGYNLANTSFFSGDGRNNTTNGASIDASVNQLIWDFGRTTAKINMAKYNYAAADLDVLNSKLACIYDIKIAYTAVLAARANNDVLAQTVKINELNTQRARAMYEVGLKAKIDVVNAEASLTEAKIALLNGQKDYQNALITLNQSMNFQDAPIYSIKGTNTFDFTKDAEVKNEINIAFDKKNYNQNTNVSIKDGTIFTSGIEKSNVLTSYKLNPFPISMSESIASALANRYDLKSYELVREAAKESLLVLKRSYYPSVNAKGSYGMTKTSDLGTNKLGLYAGLNFPEINGMYIKDSIHQGKEYVNIAEENVDILKNTIYFNVQSLYVDMKQLEQKIPLMADRVKQTQENFELADGRYAVGMGDYIELQQALVSYNNAQLAFIQSVFLYNKSRYNLERAMAVKQTYY